MVNVQTEIDLTTLSKYYWDGKERPEYSHMLLVRSLQTSHWAIMYDDKPEEVTNHIRQITEAGIAEVREVYSLDLPLSVQLLCKDRWRIPEVHQPEPLGRDNDLAAAVCLLRKWLLRGKQMGASYVTINYRIIKAPDQDIANIFPFYLFKSTFNKLELVDSRLEYFPIRGRPLATITNLGGFTCVGKEEHGEQNIEEKKENDEELDDEIEVEDDENEDEEDEKRDVLILA